MTPTVGIESVQSTGASCDNAGIMRWRGALVDPLAGVGELVPGPPDLDPAGGHRTAEIGRAHV